MKAILSSLILGSCFAFGQNLDSSKFALEPTKSDKPYFRLGGGLMWRNIGETNVNPAFAGGPAFFTPPGGVGSATAFANRTYDNGFVNIGAGTPIGGTTTNFGYPVPRPLIGNNLVFERAGGAAVGFPTGGSDDADTAIAPYLDLSYVIPVREDLEIGLNLNFAFTGLDGRFRSNVALSSVTTVDTFDVAGLTIPNAPFTGSFTGPGVNIPNIPTTRQQNVVQVGTGQYAFQQDTDLYSLALGSDILWKPTEKLTFGLGAGVVMNIADWSAQSSNPAVNPATAAFFQNTVSDSGSDFLFGFYLETSAAYRIDDNWSVEGFFRYDWTEDLDASAGATNFSVDLTGWSIGAGVTYRF